jgi:hypothetical protein
MTVNFYFHFANETWGSSSPQNSGMLQQAAAKIEFFSISSDVAGFTGAQYSKLASKSTG